MEVTSPSRVPRQPCTGQALLVCMSFQLKRTVKRAAGRPWMGRRPRPRHRGSQQPCSPAPVSGGGCGLWGTGSQRRSPGAEGASALDITIAWEITLCPFQSRGPACQSSQMLHYGSPQAPSIERTAAAAGYTERHAHAWGPRSRPELRAPEVPPHTVSSPARGVITHAALRSQQGGLAFVWSDCDSVFEEKKNLKTNILAS